MSKEVSTTRRKPSGSPRTSRLGQKKPTNSSSTKSAVLDLYSEYSEEDDQSLDALRSQLRNVEELDRLSEFNIGTIPETSEDFAPPAQSKQLRSSSSTARQGSSKKRSSTSSSKKSAVLDLYSEFSEESDLSVDALRNELRKADDVGRLSEIGIGTISEVSQLDDEQEEF
eukprot:CAMPEP_0116541948 /NCGR_PEP_ID=MMETSP0397-20121206/752_1 /TAXON_ID=216820 /ORGANISM="Cyclophora tenuis, Strain ECT3854" /LENGTH=169 /DNA_ID=CAMNT_0004065919 /DNA_START=122 /DNA_END=632 /DNA_ORIENTATION=+